MALERYKAVNPKGEERLVSGSDDFTLFLWVPETDKRPLSRMTGHQQLINDVKFSPDTRFKLKKQISNVFTICSYVIAE
jgi:ribosome assembly protein 4